jgi:hypothetical protein
MNELIKTLNKYIILLIVGSLFGLPWFYLRFWLFTSYPPESIVNSIPSLVDYLIRIVVIILLIIDYKKYNLKNIVLTCIGALFLPQLGIVIYALLYLESERTKANA